MISLCKQIRIYGRVPKVPVRGVRGPMRFQISAGIRRIFAAQFLRALISAAMSASIQRISATRVFCLAGIRWISAAKGVSFSLVFAVSFAGSTFPPLAGASNNPRVAKRLFDIRRDLL